MSRIPMEDERPEAPDGRLLQQAVERYFLHIERMTTWYPLRWGATVMDRKGWLLDSSTSTKDPYTLVIKRCGHRHKTEVAAEPCGRALFRRTVRDS
jgi:hypothetical protein